MDLIRSIPKVDKLLAGPACQRLLTEYPRPVVLAAVRRLLEELRSVARGGRLTAADLEPAAVTAGIERNLAAGELSSLRRQLPDSIVIELVPGVSQVGGGALPLAELPTWLTAIRSVGCSAGELEAGLRRQSVPVIGRIARGDFLLDLRTVADDDWLAVVEGLRAVVG